MSSFSGCKIFSKLVKPILAKSSLSDLFSITTKLLVHCSPIDVQLCSQCVHIATVCHHSEHIATVCHHRHCTHCQDLGCGCSASLQPVT